MQFHRILLQIKQLLRPVMEIPNILDIPVSQRTPVIVRVVTRSMLQIDIAPPVSGLSPSRPLQRPPVHVSRNVGSGRSQHRRQHIPQLHRHIHPRQHALRSSRPFHQERNVRRAFIRIRLPPVMMIPQHIPVVSHEDDQTPVVHPLLLQRPDDLPYLLIHKSHAGIIMPPRTARILLSEVSERRIRGHPCRISRSRILPVPIAHSRSRNLPVGIQLQEAGRRIIRTVRTRKGNLQEKRLSRFRIIIPDQFTGRPARPAGGMQTLVKDITPRPVIIPADPRTVRIQPRSMQPEPLPVITHKAHIFHPSALVEQRRMKAMAFPLRMPVHLSDAERIIPHLTQHARHLIAVTRRHLPITQHAVMPGREPREQPRPCRRTAGTRSIGMREQRSLGRQAVQCRSDHPSPARTPHGIPALLVGHDQNHMRLHPGSSRHSGSPSGHTQRQNRQHLISLHATHPPFRHGSSSTASAAQRAFPAAGVQDSPARMPPSCDKFADGCHCPSQSSAPR